jgi:GMP synthase (glutamine-hydrolysing)
MSSIVVVQHVPAEGLGRLEPLLRSANIKVGIIRPDADVDAGDIAEASGLIILGGPMSVYEADRYPRLRAEMQLIEAALERNLPILGLCLGSQLLAAVLGSQVRPGRAKELGWFDVTLEGRAQDDLLFKSMPAQFKALHWHGDVFDLPGGACHLARSALTECQAFSYGPNAWGILFHLEAGTAEVRAMAAAFPDEVHSAGTTPEHLVHVTAQEEPDTARLAFNLLGAWVGLIRAGDH